MALPTLVKTWQFSVNNTTPALGSTLTHARQLRVIKDALKAFGSNPWTCSGSSNAGGSAGVPTGTAAMDGVDRWAADTDVQGVPAGTNSRHTWMVLRQTGIAANYEICWDLTSPTTLSNMTFMVSPSAGFTGGSATARPTATDEIQMLAAVTWNAGAEAQHQIHIWQSTDGKCTRVSMHRGGTNQCVFWLFDVPQNPPTGWTNPSITSVFATAAGFAGSYANMIGTGNRGRGTATMNISYSGEGIGGTIFPNLTGVGDQTNDFDLNWPFFKMGIQSVTVANKGQHGSIFDLWWRPSAVNEADTFPNNAALRQFAALGNLIFPWTGDATIPLLT